MPAVRIGDEPLTPAAVVAAARAGAIEVELTAAARERIAASREAAERLAQRQPVYGRTTGVGANRTSPCGRRNCASTASGCCAATPAGWATRCRTTLVRATLLIRLAQIAAGGGGHRPELAEALAAVLRAARCRSCATSAGSGRAT